MRLTASEARRLPAKAGTQNEKQYVAKLMFTCLVLGVISITQHIVYNDLDRYFIWFYWEFSGEHLILIPFDG